MIIEHKDAEITSLKAQLVIEVFLNLNNQFQRSLNILLTAEKREKIDSRSGDDTATQLSKQLEGSLYC